MKLWISALVKYIAGLLLVGALLFVPAGTVAYINGWLFLGLLFLPMLAVGMVLLIKNPTLLEKRLRAKEETTAQKGVVAAAAVLFIGGFVVAGLDARFGWSHVPTAVVIVAAVVMTTAYALYAEVMRENAFLSRTIEVQDGQTVVDTGLYRVVRHPMYAVTVWLFSAMPLVLGSWWACLCFVPYIGVVIVRIRHEEAYLKKELAGYAAYTARVKYRLIPFVW